MLELLAAPLSQDFGKSINAGYTAMHAFFTQIYDRTKNKVPEILENNLNNSLQQMPRITDAEATLEDIIKISERPPKTDIIKWVIKNKE